MISDNDSHRLNRSLKGFQTVDDDWLLQQMADAWHVIAPGHDFMVIVVTPQLSRAQILICVAGVG